MRAAGMALTVLASAMAGCLGGSAPADLSPSAGLAAIAWDPCVHPWPCADGSEWPPGLAGPFGLAALERALVPSHDGVVLELWIFHPALPEGTRAPAVIRATPYLGVCNVGFNDLLIAVLPTCNEQPQPGWAEEHWFVAPLVAAGYAVVLAAVRGTGGSGGCFGMHSPEEQRDHAVVADWVAAQPWSNGRVGMAGLSYDGTTPFSAAIHAPQALKTIVPAGIISDWYTFFATPQGAKHPYAAWWTSKYEATVSLTRPVQAAVVHQDPGHASVLADRACPELAELPAREAAWVATGDRDQAFFDARRLIDRFADIEAAVLVVQGFRDAYGSGHAHQEDHVWATLTGAPKRMLLGQWEHEFPRGEGMLDGAPTRPAWDQELVAWLDFWLKGLGDPAALRLGTVDYQDTAGAWHTSAAWPPAEARAEALFLAGEALAPAPGDAERSFRAAYLPFTEAHCDLDAGLGLRYITEPLAERAVLAGNPFAHLEVDSDQRGGGFTLALLDLPADATCQDFLEPGEEGLISFGTVDLQYHRGNFRAEDFPAGAPQPVRVDLFNQAWVVEPGRRVGLAVLRDFWEFGPHQPEITLHPGSHLVLPLVEGTLGGGPLPGVDYLPRPFVPAGAAAAGGR